MKFFCLPLLGIAVFFQVMVANPDGFLNINCGASKDDTGGDGLLWVSDFPYIKVKTRESYTLNSTNNYLEYRSISYFRDLSQKKYCYLLPVKLGMHYLVRTQFDYGGFKSQLSLASVFDLLIGGVKWTTLHLLNTNSSVSFVEIILATKSEQMNLCLARNSQSEPNSFLFISTIQLRPLDSSMYKRENGDLTKKALVGIIRKNFGGPSIFYRGDKSDQYDRFWNGFQDKRYDVNTSENFETGLPNNVPKKVLQTAISAKQVSYLNMSLGFVPSYVSLSPGFYYCLFYFCNINRQTPTSFQVIINGEKKDWLEFKADRRCIFLDHNFQLGTNVSHIDVVLSPLESDSTLFINGAELYKILDVQNTHLEDVLAVREIAGAINVPDDWSGADPCLPSGYSSTGITCSEDNPPRVIIIDLTDKGLVGKIPPSIANLTALKQLLLGNNNLSGTIPDLSHLKNLAKLYLQNNSLTGTVPRGLMRQSLDLRVDPEIKFPSHRRKSWIIGISIGCSMLLILVVICTAFIWRQRPKPCTQDCPTPKAKHTSADVEGQSEYTRDIKAAIEYTEGDIKTATKNYSKVIGKGSFGSVFYGRFSGSDVAVKVLSTDSNQGQLEFYTELTVLSRIHHRNLVNLVGFCRQPVVALVYEYMERGSLKDHLYGMAKLEKPLDWLTRLNIALQAAEGLLYLHHGCNPPIIHRDIKSNNILLDGNMRAKVADFGLSKVLESSKSYVSTIVKGTLGYMDPGYYETSTLTEKSDVYSFGVVLLEIISGTSPRDGIVESGRKLISCGRLVDLMDTSLGGRYNLASAWRVAEIAYGCTERKAADRPQMSEVVKELQEAAALPEEDVNRFGNLSIEQSTEGDLPSVR